jgi:hypothetical protein
MPLRHGTGSEFFNGMRFFLRRFLHESWEDFLRFVMGNEEYE